MQDNVAAFKRLGKISSIDVNKVPVLNRQANVVKSKSTQNIFTARKDTDELLKVSIWLWPIILIVSAIAVTMMVTANVTNPVRLLLALWFLLVCPGMAYVRLFKFKDIPIEWTLAFALSLALDAFVSIVMLYAGRWSPTWGLIILASITLIGALLQLEFGIARVGKELFGTLNRAMQYFLTALLGSITIIGVVLIFLLVILQVHTG